LPRALLAVPGDDVLATPFELLLLVLLLLTRRELLATAATGSFFVVGSSDCDDADDDDVEADVSVAVLALDVETGPARRDVISGSCFVKKKKKKKKKKPHKKLSSLNKWLKVHCLVELLK
jgi:hypothetical protein